MFCIDDYDVKEKRTGFIVSNPDDSVTVKIDKKYVEAFSVREEPEKLAVLLAVIEFARINEGTKRLKKIINDEDVIDTIDFWLQYKVSAEMLINKISQMKYWEMKKFFDEDYDDEFLDEESYE